MVGRLIQHQYFRLHGQCPGKLDPLLKAVGKARNRLATDVVYLEEINDALFHILTDGHFLTPGRAKIGQRTEQSALHVHVGAQLDVVQDSHTPEQDNVLEGSGEAQCCPFRRLDTARQRLSLIADGALLGFVEAGDAVEQRCFAGTVRADNGCYGVFRHPETNVLQRLHTTKRQRQVADFEDAHTTSRHPWRRVHRHTNTPGNTHLTPEDDCNFCFFLSSGLAPIQI